MRRLIFTVLFTLAPAFAGAHAQQAPVQQDPVAAMTAPKDKMTIQECLSVLAGLQALDGRRVIVSAGKPTEGAETISYKFSGKLRDTISHNIYQLSQVQQEGQAANRRILNEVGKGNPVAPGSKEAIELDSRLSDYMARPCKADLEHIRDADLRLDENDIPGSVLALIYKIRDK